MGADERTSIRTRRARGRARVRANLGRAVNVIAGCRIAFACACRAGHRRPHPIARPYPSRPVALGRQGELVERSRTPSKRRAFCLEARKGNAQRSSDSLRTCGSGRLLCGVERTEQRGPKGLTRVQLIDSHTVTAALHGLHGTQKAPHTAHKGPATYCDCTLSPQDERYTSSNNNIITTHETPYAPEYPAR